MVKLVHGWESDNVTQPVSHTSYTPKSCGKWIPVHHQSIPTYNARC